LDSTAAILITTPSAQQVLVDGGPSPTAPASALGHQMPFWDLSIDLAVLTRPGAGHITGLPEVLDRYEVAGRKRNEAKGIDPAFSRAVALSKLPVSDCRTLTPAVAGVKMSGQNPLIPAQAGIHPYCDPRPPALPGARPLRSTCYRDHRSCTGVSWRYDP
jgi:hypothetical protein